MYVGGDRIESNSEEKERYEINFVRKKKMQCCSMYSTPIINDEDDDDDDDICNSL